MINLNFEYLDEPIQIEHCTSFVIANTALFTKVIESLYQCDDETNYVRFFDADYQNLKNSELMIVADILGFDLNAANVLKLIYHDLELQISERPEKKNAIERLLYEATELVNEELLDFDIDLAADEITFLEMLKALGVQIEVKSDTIFERVFEIMQVFKYLSKKKILVLINSGVYFSQVEIQAIAEYATLQNLPLLLLDKCKVPGLKTCYFLDDDYCLMREKMV